MTTSKAKAAGSAAERLVAKLLGGRRVGQLLGPVDVVVEGWLDVQVKTLTTPPSLHYIQKCLDAMPKDAHLRGVVIIERNGRGNPNRATITFDLREFADWHGGEG